MRPATLLVLTISLAVGATAVAADRGAMPLRVAKAPVAQTKVCPSAATGSRIRRPDGECAQSAYAIRSVTGEQLLNTGTLTTRNALRLIDPRY